MTGDLIVAFVLVCLVIWLVLKSRSRKASPPAVDRSARAFNPTQHGEFNAAGKWVDTIRRDSLIHSALDTEALQSTVIQNPEPSTLIDDAAEPGLRETQEIALEIVDTPSKPTPIKATYLSSASADASAIDLQITALHKEATQSKSKDWPTAIAALQKAAVLDAAHNRWNDMTRMVRLPTFLQQAGRFEEAMAEFDRLIERVPSYVQEHTANKSDELARGAALHREYELLYDKMRLACKRQKEHELAEKYAQKSTLHREAMGDLKELKKTRKKKQRKK
jgi:tetratricopeptide (TPR) repeat protein